MTTEVYESFGKEIDFDQRNEENFVQLTTRYGASTTMQLSQQ